MTEWTYQWWVEDEHGNEVIVKNAKTFMPPASVAPGSTIRCVVAPRFGSDFAHGSEEAGGTTDYGAPVVS